ncbi:MAG: hypothetical protein ACFCGT_18160 [Sandaracinaceae bacterium]
MRGGAGSALIVAVLAATSAARAQIPGSESPGGWPELVEPARREGRRLLRQGLDRVLRAMGEPEPNLGEPPRWVLLAQAITHLEGARRSLGDDPDLLYLLAHAHSRYERRQADGTLERHVDQAMAVWHRLREVAPDMHPDRVAVELAQLHTMRRQFSEARAEYGRAAAHHVPPTTPTLAPYDSAELRLQALYGPVSRSSLYGNLAEVTMLDGDVDEAVTHYQAAAREARNDPVAYALALWGMSLALDRRGDHEAALSRAWQAVQANPAGLNPHLTRTHGPFAVLHAEWVFFEPPSEIHAYQALGREAIAERERGDRRAIALREALRQWHLYLEAGGTSPAFDRVARGHVERLEGLVGDEAEEPRRRPDPLEVLRGL